jgi:hypothetical protein
LFVIAPRLPDGLPLSGRANRRTTMMTSHPIRNLASNLEEKRLQLIEKLASDTPMSADAMKELATVQTALTAVREAIDEHGPRMGWGSDQELA